MDNSLKNMLNDEDKHWNTWLSKEKRFLFVENSSKFSFKLLNYFDIESIVWGVIFKFFSNSLKINLIYY